MLVTEAPQSRSATAEYSPQSKAEPPIESAPTAVSLLRFGALLLKHYRLVFGIPTCCAVVVLAISLVQHRNFTSRASFLPQSDGPGSMLGNISGLAAQLGVVVPQNNPAQAPAFFVDLVTSRPILESLVTSRYGIRIGPAIDSMDLVTLYKVPDDGTLAQRRLRAMKRLRASLEVSADPKTQVVGFSVTTKWPEVSAEVAQRILNLINEFNLKRRQDQAAAQRSFVDERLRQSLSEFRAAQNALADFGLRNRVYQGDPLLVNQHDRLVQEVSLRQQVYVALAQSYEQARIDAARDLPVITVVEPPEEAALPDPRGALTKAIAAFLASFLVIAAAVFGTYAIRTDYAATCDALAFRAAASAAIADAIHLASVGRLGRRAPPA